MGSAEATGCCEIKRFHADPSANRIDRAEATFYFLKLLRITRLDTRVLELYLRSDKIYSSTATTAMPKKKKKKKVKQEIGASQDAIIIESKDDIEQQKYLMRHSVLSLFYKDKFNIHLIVEAYKRLNTLSYKRFENNKMEITLHQETKLTITRLNLNEPTKYSMDYFKALGLITAVLIDYLRRDWRFQNIEGSLDYEDKEELINHQASRIHIPKYDPLYYFYGTGYEILYEHYPDETMAVAKFKCQHPIICSLKCYQHPRSGRLLWNYGFMDTLNKRIEILQKYNKSLDYSSERAWELVDNLESSRRNKMKHELESGEREPFRFLGPRPTFRNRRIRRQPKPKPNPNERRPTKNQMPKQKLAKIKSERREPESRECEANVLRPMSEPKKPKVEVLNAMSIVKKEEPIEIIYID